MKTILKLTLSLILLLLPVTVQQCKDCKEPGCYVEGKNTICNPQYPCKKGTGQCRCPDGHVYDLVNDINHCGSCTRACKLGQKCKKATCVCLDGLTDCTGHGDCFNLGNDSQNCGQCGHQCGDLEACVYGQCVSTCPSGWKACNGVCVEPQSDIKNCGDCGIECRIDQVCEGGDCKCQSGYAECDQQNPVCIDLQTTPANCGTCGHACDVGEYCNAGSCAPIPRCPAGTFFCFNKCYTLPTDLPNVTVAFQNPDGVTCEIEQCVEGFGDCNQQFEDGCETTTLTNEKNCGKCGIECVDFIQSCISGVCTCNELGLTACTTGCFNILEDELHCGDCTTACQGAEQCVDGHCTCVVPPSIICNVDQCVDPLTDSLNCGGCGQVCPDGSHCVDGACVCTTQGETLCPGVGCFNFDTNNNNCGKCGVVCTAPKTCSYGICCDPGTFNCNGTCLAPTSSSLHIVNITFGNPGCLITQCQSGFGDCPGTDGVKNPLDGCETDLTTSSNCGACGTVCANDQTCNFSDAPVQCECNDNTLTVCNGVCVNTLTSGANCGGCNNGCGAGTTCTSGHCCIDPLQWCGSKCIDPTNVPNTTYTQLGNGNQCTFTCSVGFDSCDNDPSNGCETDILNNPQYCGGCNAPICLTSCVNGICQ